MNKYFENHEKQYQQLQEQNAEGWWGASERFAAWRETLELLKKNPEFPPSGDLLELGSGAGNVAHMFAAEGYKVSGVEISPTGVEWAKEKYPYLDFKVGDVTELSSCYGAESFDIVVDGNCVHCISEQDREKLWRGVQHVLKPGGVFFVSSNTAEGNETKVLHREGAEYRFYLPLETMIANASAVGLECVWHQESPRSGRNHLLGLFRKA